MMLKSLDLKKSLFISLVVFAASLTICLVAAHFDDGPMLRVAIGITAVLSGTLIMNLLKQPVG